MDNIDMNLNKLMQQIDAIDGGGSGLSTTTTMTNSVVMYCRKYFFYWASFVFSVIFILVVRPSSMYSVDTKTGRRYFQWSSFFVSLFSLYFFILILYWGHYICNV